MDEIIPIQPAVVPDVPQIEPEPEPTGDVLVFDPPIQVNPDIIAGDMVVTTAAVIPQDNPTQVVAAIYGDGRVIGVPFVDSAENSIRVALS